jgi:hypothetical protein
MDVNIDTVIESASDDAPNARSWKAFADQINGTWRKGAGNFIECGRLLAEAKDELSRDAFNAMVRSKLDFEASVGRKLMLVGTNSTLCAHGHKLPPCWTTLYQLSQLPEDVLKAALDDGTVHPGMQRKDAEALKPPKPTKTPAKSAAKPATDSSGLSAVWQSASQEQRRAFLDELGREGLCAAMSGVLLADLRDHVINPKIAGASRSSAFATYATDKLHVALRCAEQPEPDEESIRHMAAALRLIIKKAAAGGVTRSDVVVAEGGKRKGRK